ncbi:MAG: cytochrome c [Desulfocapsaceae bacterium]|nr:cytochrome c [Desulfocapsaceae bacterium]
MAASSQYRMLVSMVLFGSLLFLAACNTPQGDPENGKKWFAMHNCSSCHGPHGNDGKAPHIAGLDMGYGKFVRKLRSSDSPIMPTFPESTISQQDAADIYAYLKSIK